MKRLILLLLIASPLWPQTVNSNIIPASTGLNLGRSGQRWNVFAQNMDISGTCRLNGLNCFGANVPTMQINGVDLLNPNIVNFLNSATCTWSNPSAGQVSLLCASGSGNPGGNPFSLQTNVAGITFGGVNLNTGETIAGTAAAPIAQRKPIYDARDWMTCDGSTDTSSGMSTLLSTIGTTEATIRFLGNTTASTSCRVGNTFFDKNITLDFSGGGSLQLVSSTTPPGGAAFVNGTGVECGAGTSCALPALNITTGNTIIVLEAPYPGFTFKTTQVTDDCGDFFIHTFQSLANQPRNQGAWIASSAHGGNCTITATANGSLTTHMMIAQQYSGLGPVASLDTSASLSVAGANPMSSGAATVTAGSLVIGFGGQPFTAETCTAGAGFTQPASLAGQTTNGFMCAEYQLSAAGGSLTATQNITAVPANQVYSLVALKPGNATATIWGGIHNPDQHKIFYNADSATGHGVIDFTGSPITQDVYPEWWGALPTATAAVNTPALQAAVWAAFGGGLTQRRTNASGLSIYNRPLRLGGLYQINDELKFYSVNGFTIYGNNRLLSGIQQTASNKRIIDGQSISYGHIHDVGFSGTASSTLPLIDLDYNGVTTAGDLRPQFIDFDRVNFSGASQVAQGVLIAKSGGGAQGSNIYCRDCAAQSFTEAAWQIGTHTNLAGNALAIGFSGDIQGCPKFGIASYGGGYISFGDGVEESSMENASQGLGTQTGFDMYCELTQGPCSMDYVRSESRRLISGNDIVMHKTRMINSAFYVPPGSTDPVGSIVSGSVVGGDGAYYTVTNNGGPANGIGTPAAALRASSGSATTLVDTNQNITGAVTIGLFNATNETVTQAVTGSTGTALVRPASNATISGTLTSGSFVSGHTGQQAVTGVTCTIGAGNTAVLFNCTNFSGTANGTDIWTDLTTLGTFTPSGAPVFAASTMLITAATGAPDNSHDWVGGTSAAHFTPTTLPVNQANFTVNGFVGMTVSTLAGLNAGCYGTITANTATDITLAAGWTTRYAKLNCPGPDTTSSFLVEPTWNHGTITDGGMTLVYLDENAIDCQTTFGTKGGCSPQGRLEDVIVAGGKIQVGASSNFSIHNLQVYRQDWYAGTNAQQPFDLFADWDVHIISTVSPGIVPYQGLFYQQWSLPPGTGSYTGANQWRLGTKALVWDIGNVNQNNPPANTQANSTWIGGRTDNAAGTDATRAILEFGGMLGRGAPLPSASNAFNTTDLNGTDTDITGGPSTGTGTGGAINFYTSVPGSTGRTVNSGALRAKIDANGLSGVASVSTSDATSFGAAESYTSAKCETAGAPTTLSTIATTTDTGLLCLPVNSVIDAVVYRITTTITTAANFTIGDATTAARFCGTQSTLTAGTTGTCFVQADQTGAAGPRQTTAVAVRVTTNVNPGAGAIRLIVFYHTWTPPTS